MLCIGVPISQEPFPDEDEKVKRYELNLPMSDMEKRRKKLKKLAQKEQKKLKSQQDENNAELEIVPQKRAEDYEIDELATNLALAKKMLRKKTREQIINDSFGRERYDDHDELPKWFVEDEQKHVYKIAPITKEEFEAEKQRLYEINSRVPKKVLVLGSVGHGSQDQEVEAVTEAAEEGLEIGFADFGDGRHK